MSKSNNNNTRLFWIIIACLGFIVLAPLSWVAYRLAISPTQLVPYPYEVQRLDYADQNLAEKTTVLIVGDRMGKALEAYLPQLVDKSSVNLKTPLPIFNWSKEHENLARTLAKLKSLKKIPPVIVYLGASEEGYERRYDPRDLTRILKNFERYEDVKFQSLIMTTPILSRLIYTPIRRTLLGKDPIKDSTSYTAEGYQLLAELNFKLFTSEVQDLINWAKENKTQLILNTTPINLETLPHQVCENTTTENLKTYQEEIMSRIAKDDLKATLAELKELNQKIIGNALNFHLLGSVYLKMGQLSKAREEYIKAAAYDCSPWRTNPIHNIIIEKAAIQSNVRIVDFDRVVNQNLGQDVTFLSELYPQHIYYQQYVNLLSHKIMEILKI